MQHSFQSPRRSALLRRLKRLAALATLAGASVGALAAYPERPITLVIPFSPGGSSDNVGRAMAPLLGDKLGQSIVVDNVGGAGGLLGTQRTVRAAPDGYTLLVGSGSEILINKIINPKLPVDGMKDLTPVLFVATGPMVLVGRPSLAPNTMAELLAYAKANPGKLSYASAGNGTPMHVAGEWLKMKGQVFMTHIPYRGASPALVDLMGGQVDLAVSTLSAALPYIRSGKVKAYGVTSSKRSDLAPDLPALGQVKALEGLDLGVWFGLFLPAKTAPDIVQKVQTAAAQVMADPAVRKKLAEQGLAASGASAEELRAFMAEEVRKYQRVVEAAKITAE